MSPAFTPEEIQFGRDRRASKLWKARRIVHGAAFASGQSVADRHQIIRMMADGFCEMDRDAEPHRRHLKNPLKWNP